MVICKNNKKLIFFIFYYTMIIYSSIYNLCIDYVFSTEIPHLNESTYNTSGNKIFDEVKDAINTNNNNGFNNPGPNNPGPNNQVPNNQVPNNIGPGNVEPSNVEPSHTVRLANYLADSRKTRISGTGIKVNYHNGMSILDRNMSKITLETRREYPNLFSLYLADTRINNNLMGTLRHLDRNFITLD